MWMWIDPSVIRQINSIDPVKGANNKDLNCGHSAQKASLVADVQPGSSLQFFWLAGGGQNVSWRILSADE